MTASAPPRPAGSAAPAQQAGGGTGRRRTQSSLALDDVRRTLLVALGSVLGLLPMRTVFDDNQWLVEALGAVVVLIAPAAALRLLRGPRAAQLLPGLALVAVYAVVLYLHASAIHGLVPGRDSWHVIADLRRQAETQVSDNIAPMTSTRALRIQVVPGLALLVAVIDYLAVVRRSPALAGIPLLALYTICGASAGTSVGWFPFACAAAGFLLILSADSRVNLMRWGRIIPRRTGEHVGGAPRLGLSGRRIGVFAVIIALVVPLAVPGLSRNLLASAFHPQAGGGGGNGTGATGTGLSPFANLRGNLNESKTVELLSVHVTSKTDPFYLRSKVLDQFTATGWKASGAQDATVPVDQGRLDVGGNEVTSTKFDARVQVSALNDSAAPTFGKLQNIGGLDSDWKYSFQTSTVSGGRTARGLVYTEQVSQPDPTAAALRASDKQSDPSVVDSRWSVLPASVPAQVRTIVADLTRGKGGAYAKARALSDFFTDQQNGFIYDLQTKAGDSGSDLVDFLNNRTGFCQQYAAALAVMLRLADIPSRVVLGYTHQAVDKQGTFAVTNRDAHAWVEAYLPSVGWLPFDPTPIDPSRATRLAYAPHATQANPSPSAEEKVRPTATRSTSTAPSAAPAAVTSTGAHGVRVHVPAWLWKLLTAILVAMVALAVLPTRRWLQRRRRLRSAHLRHTVEPLWDELYAGARDAGAGWSTGLTPRQVPQWLAGLGITASGDVRRLAARVEQERYARSTVAPSAAEIDDYSRTVASTSADLLHRMDGRARLLARLRPASLFRRR